jgi:hypothetical protein
MRYCPCAFFVVVAKSGADAGNCSTSSLLSDHVGHFFLDTNNMSIKKTAGSMMAGWVDPKNGDAAKNWWLPSGKLT